MTGADKIINPLHFLHERSDRRPYPDWYFWCILDLLYVVYFWAFSRDHVSSSLPIYCMERLVSGMCQAGSRLKHLSWRLQWIFLCILEQRMAVLREISRADRRLFGLYLSLSTRSSTAMRRTRSTAPGCRTIIPILRILFSRLSMLLSFQPLSGNYSTAFVHHTALTDRDFQSKSPLSVKCSWFSWFCLIFSGI